MKIPDERIEEIRAAEKAATSGPWKADFLGCVTSRTVDIGETYQENGDPAFIAIARTAIPELLSEREEREKEIERSTKEIKRLFERIAWWERRWNGEVARAESVEKALEALRDWALTARRLWGGGGGVHWKRFYAILDAGKPTP